MGFFDQAFRNEATPKLKTSDAALMMLPVAGPFIAASRIGRRKKKEQDLLDAQQEKVADYVDEDSPLSGRVAARMLTRTGEETLPGVIANTGLKRAFAENPNNPGNAYAQASSTLGKYYPAEATKMAQFAHKELQTPWKPNEATAENVSIDPDLRLPRSKKDGSYLPNKKGWVKYSRRDGEQMVEGWQPVYTDENGEVKFGTPEDVTKGTVYSSKQEFNIGGPVLPDGKAADDLLTWEDQMEGADQTLSFIKGLRPNVASGTIGIPGAITELAAKAGNTVNFIAGITRNFGGVEDAQKISEYQSDITKLAEKLPIRERALAEYYVIGLAYSLARRHNFGSSDGGRNISNQDMEYALKRLQAATSPEALMAVLTEEENETFRHLGLRAERTRRLLKGNPAKQGAFEEGLASFGTRWGKNPGSVPYAEQPNKTLTPEEINAIIQGKRNRP